jgi:hypothetical protein
VSTICGYHATGIFYAARKINPNSSKVCINPDIIASKWGGMMCLSIGQKCNEIKSSGNILIA